MKQEEHQFSLGGSDPPQSLSSERRESRNIEQIMPEFFHKLNLLEDGGAGRPLDD